MDDNDDDDDFLPSVDELNKMINDIIANTDIVRPRGCVSLDELVELWSGEIATEGMKRLELDLLQKTEPGAYLYVHSEFKEAVLEMMKSGLAQK